jgi:protein-S-isoprenylcysteine O-methyltransferase Ste14
MIPLDRNTVAITVALLWLIWAAYWTVNAFGNKRSVYKQSLKSRLLYLAAAIVVFTMIRNSGTSRIPIFRETISTQITGLAMCAAGIALAIHARRILGSNWSGLITLKENHELIRNGPYRFVRHPIYSGLILAVAGTVIATNPTALGLCVFALVAIGLKLKSLGEEKILIPKFPESYPQYKRQVKSLIPYVW